MTKDEFRDRLLVSYFDWCGSDPRDESGWWLSLTGFAEREFNRAFDRETRVRREVDS